MITNLFDRLGDSNPQLFRELKGRFIPRNLLIVGSLIFVSYGLIWLVWMGTLPHNGILFHQYCLGLIPDAVRQSQTYVPDLPYCAWDALGHTPINWAEASLALFVPLTMLAIGIFLVVGVHLLSGDLAKEQERSTLNFIRLSPQSANAIFLGKMLGVPSLLYLFLLAHVPLHLGLAFVARIHPLAMIAFYILTILTGGLFFSGALFYSLVSTTLKGFSSWFASGSTLYFIWLISAISSHLSSVSHTSLDAFLLVYPGNFLPYLMQTTGLGSHNNLYDSGIKQLVWWHLPLGEHSALIWLFMVINLSLGIYWFSRALQRYFHRPGCTFLTKGQSYALSGGLTLLLLGFLLKTVEVKWLSETVLITQTVLNFFLLMLFWIVLHPGWQSLLDWTQYHHLQEGKAHLPLWDFLWGEKSPPFLALGIHSVILNVPLLLIIGLSPLENRLSLGLTLLIQMSLFSLIILITYRLWLLRGKKQEKQAAGTVVLVLLFPFLIYAFGQISPEDWPGLWLWCIVPTQALMTVHLPTLMANLLGQGLAIVMLSFSVRKQIHCLGSTRSQKTLARSPQS